MHPRQLKFPTGAPVSQPYLCHLLKYFCGDFSHKEIHRAPKYAQLGKSPDTRESQRAGLPVSQPSKKHVLWLLSYHKAMGAVVSCSSRQEFSCRLALQATLADCIIGFKVAGHVENRATFPVHCFPWDKRILHRSLQRNLSNEMPGPICSGRNHSPAFKKC